jgi:alanine dehydrogenase
MEVLVLVLSAADVRRVLDMPSAIEAVREAHIAHATGQVVMPVRLSMAWDERPSEMEAMPAFLGNVPAFGVKLITYVGTNASRGLPAISAVIVLFDPDDGHPIAVMDGAVVTATRTAAASALATRLLAREDTRVLAIAGAGVQGRSHLRAMLEARAFESVRVVDDDRARAEAFVREAVAEHPSLDVRVAGSVREAVDGADVIVTATTSPTPILEWDWIAPGTHVNAIGSHSPGVRELAADVVSHARIVVDSRESALKEAGDFLIAIRDGALSAERIDVELGQVAAGLRPGRESRDEVTLYKSCGIALQDVGTAKLVLDRATAAGIGTEVAF